MKFQNPKSKLSFMKAKVKKRTKFSSPPKFQNSFTLVEVLIGTFLILIVFLGIFGLYQLSLKVVSQGERKIIATNIATQEMERIRNLSYNSIGTKSAILPFAEGLLDNSTTTIRNSVEYTIETEIKYTVDEADGSGEQDSCNWDYKKVGVNIFWQGRFQGQVKLTSDVAPKNKIEETQACLAQPGGILSVSVFDAQGVMVPSPLIEIINPISGSVIDFATPLLGQYDFPLATATYKAVVSKAGFSQERTYGVDEIATPEKPHPIVLDGKITETSFSIDRLGSMTVQTSGSRGLGYPPIHGAIFTLTGSKIIGTDISEDPVYKYSQSQTTDGPGKIEISNLEWDSYTLSVDPISGLDLVEIESPPGATTTQPISLAPLASLDVRLILQAENSFLLTIQDATTSEPIFSATARLFNLAIVYNVTQYTGENGQTYFIPLQTADYDLEVGASGYLSTSTNVSISGDVFKTIKLEQIE